MKMGIFRRKSRDSSTSGGSHKGGSTTAKQQHDGGSFSSGASAGGNSDQTETSASSFPGGCGEGVTGVEAPEDVGIGGGLVTLSGALVSRRRRGSQASSQTGEPVSEHNSLSDSNNSNRNSSSDNNNNTNTPNCTRRRLLRKKSSKIPPPVKTVTPTIDMVPQLIQELSSSLESPSSDTCHQALRKLFQVSEGVHYTKNRIEMVRVSEGLLVPILLALLVQCDRSSTEQYLTLLVLNNLSVPHENKRLVAIEYGGAKVLSRMLCDDPSCHLVPIILVNLTFCDAEMRSELVSNPDTHLVESLAFGLRIASLTQSEYEHRQPLVESDPENPSSTAQLLKNMLSEDQRHRTSQTATKAIITRSNTNSSCRDEHVEDEEYHLHLLPPTSQQLFPETARWTLTAIKNLTRPCRDATAACAFINIGIVPHIFRFITLSSDNDYHSSGGGTLNGRSCSGIDTNPSMDAPSDERNALHDRVVAAHMDLIEDEDDGDDGVVVDEERQVTAVGDFSKDDGTREPTGTGASAAAATSSAAATKTMTIQRKGTPTTMSSTTPSEYANSPNTWDSNSAQDAALFVVLNFSSASIAREFLKEVDAIHMLTAITNYQHPQLQEATQQQSTLTTTAATAIYVQQEILEFQRLKARMALSYLVGSEGHYGQPRPSRGAPTATSVFCNPDDSCLIVTDGEVPRLVELLAATLHRRGKEGAGGYSAATFNVKHVLFALRCLLTHYENQVKFSQTQGAQVNALLMKILALYSLQHVVYIDAEAAEHAAFSLYILSNYCFTKTFLPSVFGGSIAAKSLTCKVLSAYINQREITPAGKHAAEQILNRFDYLIFEGTPADLAVKSGSSTMASDFCLDVDLFKLVQDVHVAPFRMGARPDKDIYDRPLLRRRPLTKGGSHRLPWNNLAMVDTFPNALIAVQELSYMSTKVRHVNRIDDVLIANNIVHSANGEKTESYNYMWSWQDTAGEIQRNLEQQRSSDSFLSPTTARKVEKHFSPALSLLDSLCGPVTR